jgi:methylglutaconyl-CoA hydratase
VPAGELAAECRRKLDSLLTSGPEAVRVAKELIGRVAGLSPGDAMDFTVETIADRRSSEEAREGLTAFLEKRAPGWAAKGSSERRE